VYGRRVESTLRKSGGEPVLRQQDEFDAYFATKQTGLSIESANE
jgi:hypothetical protein